MKNICPWKLCTIWNEFLCIIFRHSPTREWWLSIDGESWQSRPRQKRAFLSNPVETAPTSAGPDYRRSPVSKQKMSGGILLTYRNCELRPDSPFGLHRVFLVITKKLKADQERTQAIFPENSSKFVIKTQEFANWKPSFSFKRVQFCVKTFRKYRSKTQLFHQTQANFQRKFRISKINSRIFRKKTNGFAYLSLV